jgi:3-hydroxyisobutyrate dehydrogenase-like beta-hydroxyacid dehydrogenase
MLRHDFTTLFKLEHMLKDVRHALQTGDDAGAPFLFAAQTGELLKAGVGRGLGTQDFAAVVQVLEDLADVRLDD